MKRQWFYRGYLKSCNYSCSYCPFSKKKGSVRELKQDRQAFFRFINRIDELPSAEGAIQIIPYGEALIHPYYWEGLARLSQNPRLDAVGAQSNFSFPVRKMLSVYCQHGGVIKKLRLWGTFHPEMTTAEQFIKQCTLLSSQNVSYCVGAVGVPEQLDTIRFLRKSLPGSIYLWINKMDGMKRSYTPSETKNFLEIDPYFELELIHHKANAALCADSRFVEADGAMRQCNLSRQNLGNFYDNPAAATTLSCARKECSCYLAYCNRMEPEMISFLPYPSFRIPKYPKAVFLDVDGTLIPDGEMQIPKRYVRWLKNLANYSNLYLATSLPYEAARKSTHAVWPYLCGGVFANGARRIIRKSHLDEIEPIDTNWLERVQEKKSKYGFHLHIYKKESIVYKVTLTYRKGRMAGRFSKEYLDELSYELGIPETCQLLAEQDCIQITKRGTSKLAGIKNICESMGYSRQETAAIGNSESDIPMLEYFPYSINVEKASRSNHSL